MLDRNIRTQNSEEVNAMFKLKMLINASSVMTILFCLYPINSSIGGDCDGKSSGVGTPTVTGNYNYAPDHDCTEDPDLVYDTVNSDETIDRNGSATLFVIGKNAPYTWSVSGTGFTLKNEEPTGPTNTLYADDTACGAATVTATGCDGPPVTGYVRCTTGGWSLFPVDCHQNGGAGTNKSTEIVGNKKYETYWGCMNDRFGTDTSCCDKSPAATTACALCATEPSPTMIWTQLTVRTYTWECW